MDNDKYIITIHVASLNGKKTTSTQKEYWELVDSTKKKYRVWTEAMYNRFNVGQTYDVEISEMEGSFINDKGKTIDYKLQTIHNIIKMPDVKYDPSEPIDKAIGQTAIGEQGGDIDSKSPQSIPTPSEYKPRDFDAENRGKIRSLLLQSLVNTRGLEPLTENDKTIIDDMVEYAMVGK